MTDSPADLMLQAARKLWGNETSHRGNIYRWGGKEGRKIDLKDLVWHDHTGELINPKTGKPGGGWTDLCKLAGNLPKGNGRERPNGHTKHAEFQRVHDFRDEQRHLLFQECKRLDGRWVQRRPNGKDWLYNLDGVRRVLFRLPELLAADHQATVFLPEGPKDCDTLVGLGFIATCNPGGAEKWRDEFNQFLAGRQCVILPDNDEPGERHAAQVNKALSSTARVVTIRLPGLASKGDVSDWVKAGGTREELIELVREARGEDPAWLAKCQRSDAEKNPKPVPNLHNAYLAITHDPHFARFVKKDEMLRATLLDSKPLKDENVVKIRDYLQKRGLKRVSRDDVRDALNLHAYEHSFHPVRDWLESLRGRWDGSPRVGTWLTVYLGVESNSYTAAIGQMFLIAMVARIFEPGCQADYAIVLEGPQGELKSSALRALGGEWFDDNLPDVTNKDSSQYLRGKWLVEISELHALSKADNTDIKRFITRRVERYFARYGHTETFEPRQTLFAGTSNNDRYIKDDTGGRRWWPIVCGLIKLDSLKRDREQLFAEAVHLYHQKVPYWPDRTFEKEFIRPEQEARFDADDWTQTIADYIRLLTRTTGMEIAKGCLGFESASRLGKADQMRIASILQRLGWVRKSDGTARYWERPS